MARLKQQHRSARSILAAQKRKRKEDALALAEVIYDVFKEEKASGKIISGQNDVQVSNG